MRLLITGVVGSLIALGVPACSTSTEPESPADDSGSGTEADTIALVADFDPSALRVPTAGPETLDVRIGIFLHSRQGPEERTWLDREAEQVAGAIIRASTDLAQCDLRLRPEVFQVISLPLRLWAVRGTDGETWGGHPPEGTENPALFNYRENNRLTDDTRELFGYGKRFTSPNSMPIFVVEKISYATKAGGGFVAGLSFDPNLYHHPDDYPHRNSILIALDVESTGLPAPGSWTTHTVAHELGHMLLNSGLHTSLPYNLMSEYVGHWDELTPEQCERMRHVREWLYGEEEIADPGPP